MFGDGNNFHGPHRMWGQVLQPTLKLIKYYFATPNSKIIKYVCRPPHYEFSRHYLITILNVCSLISKLNLSTLKCTPQLNPNYS